MSFHNHEGEEYNRRFGVHERQKEEQKKKRDEQLVNNIMKDVEKVEAKRDAEIQRDFMMLDRLKEFDLTEKDVRWIKHLIGLPDGRGIPMLVNYIQARTGSCILHYDNKFVQNMPLGNFNERHF